MSNASKQSSLIRKLPLVAALAATLAACGGGGSSTSAPGAGGAATTGGATPFASMLGVYRTGCERVGTQQSQVFTVTLSNLVGTDSVSGRMDYQGYNTTDCTGAVSEDVAISGTLRALGTTKQVAGGDANIGEFELSALRISAGTFGTIPLPGTKARVGWRLDGAQLRVLSGSRQPDGLPARYSSRVATRQP